MDAASEFVRYTFSTSSRVLIASEDICSIMPTFDEFANRGGYKLSAKARAVKAEKAEKLAEGVPDELARSQACLNEVPQ